MENIVSTFVMDCSGATPLQTEGYLIDEREVMIPAEKYRVWGFELTARPRYHGTLPLPAGARLGIALARAVGSVLPANSSQNWDIAAGDQTAALINTRSNREVFYYGTALVSSGAANRERDFPEGNAILVLPGQRLKALLIAENPNSATPFTSQILFTLCVRWSHVK